MNLIYNCIVVFNKTKDRVLFCKRQNLRRTDIQSDDLKLVARALLPAEINVGTKLKYEIFQYEVIG